MNRVKDKDGFLTRRGKFNNVLYISIIYKTLLLNKYYLT